MGELAIDRFSLSPGEEAAARDMAEQLGPYRLDPHTAAGFLSSAIAIALERWWRPGARRRLALDLRAIQMNRERPARHDACPFCGMPK